MVASLTYYLHACNCTNIQQGYCYKQKKANRGSQDVLLLILQCLLWKLQRSDRQSQVSKEAENVRHNALQVISAQSAK